MRTARIEAAATGTALVSPVSPAYDMAGSMARP
jgi:hypothetical protein